MKKERIIFKLAGFVIACFLLYTFYVFGDSGSFRFDGKLMIKAVSVTSLAVLISFLINKFSEFRKKRKKRNS